MIKGSEEVLEEECEDKLNASSEGFVKLLPFFESCKNDKHKPTISSQTFHINKKIYKIIPVTIAAHL